MFAQNEDPATIWSKLRYLGFIKNNNKERRLVYTAEELNKYFAGGAVREDCSAIPQANETFDDNKLYFQYTTPKTISKSFFRIKSKCSQL